METTVKERPILFSAPMVRALLDGRKTQTRRIVKNLTVHPDRWVWAVNKHSRMTLSVGERIKSPYGEPGDRLWVREEHYRVGHWDPVATVRTRTPKKLASTHTRRRRCCRSPAHSSAS